jgi:protein-S-isoprenylcysteine O-methyltransferase Ste14
MTNPSGDAALAAPPTNESAKNVWRRIFDFLTRWRIRITVVVFVLLVAEDVIEGVVPHDLLNFRDVKTLLGLGLVAAGLALRSWAAGILHKRTQLTTVGPYALVRHPLYIGSFLMMLGFCTLVDDTENIWFVLGPFVVLYALHIFNEERILAREFGDRWTKYAGSVSWFFPRHLRGIGPAAWSLAQWTSNREYQAVGATLLGLAALETWRWL